MSDERDEVLRRLAAGHVLWDCYGLYGGPVTECSGGIVRVKGRTFDRLLRSGLIEVRDKHVTGWTYGLTEAGRAAAGVHRASDAEEGASA